MADVLLTYDYYPFGSTMPGRSFSSNSYRYGFNGKESDNEVSGNGNSYDYGFRIYNPRIGKFLSVDPLTKSFPYYTPYQFSGNTPIQAVDLDGLEILDYRDKNFTVIVGDPLFSDVDDRRVFSLVNSNTDNVHASYYPDVDIYRGSSSQQLSSSNSSTEPSTGEFVEPVDLRNGKYHKGNYNVMNSYQNRANKASSGADLFNVASKTTYQATLVSSSFKGMDRMQASDAFKLAYMSVIRNENTLNKVYENINWSSNFKEGMSSGRIDITSDHFLADVMNYVVDGRLSGDDGAPNFQYEGYGEDFVQYKNAVFKAGEYILSKEKINIKQPENNTGLNVGIETYKKVAGGQ